jgi:hypothetical protein
LPNNNKIFFFLAFEILLLYVKVLDPPGFVSQFHHVTRH